MVGCRSTEDQNILFTNSVMEPKEGMLVVKVGRPDMITNLGHQHEYLIQNGSGINFYLFTNSEFKLGDFVEFTKQRPFP